MSINRYACVPVGLFLIAGAGVRAPAQSVPPPERATVDVDGHKLALWSRHPAHPTGVILLLHGRTWSALPDFDLQVPGEHRSVMLAFKTRGYATYALDLAGYGASPRDTSGWMTPDHAAADLAGVLRWIAARHPTLPRPVLLGWSNGSLVAHLLAQREPALISGLVLYGFPLDVAVQIPTVSTPIAAPREANTAKNAASDFISPDVMTQKAIDEYVRVALKADPTRADWRALEQWNAIAPEQISVPTLLLQGERDPLAPAAAQARLFTRLGTPDRRWVVLAGGDHAALLEDTQSAFVAAVSDFIQRPRRPAALRQ